MPKQAKKKARTSSPARKPGNAPFSVFSAFKNIMGRRKKNESAIRKQTSKK